MCGQEQLDHMNAVADHGGVLLCDEDGRYLRQVLRDCIYVVGNRCGRPALTPNRIPARRRRAGS